MPAPIGDRCRARPEKLSYDRDFEQVPAAHYTHMRNETPSLKERLGRYSGATAAAMCLDWDTPAVEPMAHLFENLLNASTCPYSGEVIKIHPLALQIRLNGNPEQPTFSDVLKMDDTTQNEWMDSMDKELEALHKQKALKIVDHSKAIGRQICNRKCPSVDFSG